MEVKVFEGLEYLISYPDGFQEDKKYPLVIFLHGAGTRGEEIDRLKRNTEMCRYLFLCEVFTSSQIS